MTEDQRPTGTVEIRPLDQPGDLGWVVMAHGELYAEEYRWDGKFEALVARIVADFASDHDPARETAWIAELDGKRVGCVFCVRDDDGAAQLRILLVHPDARGLGAGKRLVDQCLEFAREVGYTRMRLWTNDVLSTAREIYLKRGFRLIDEKPHSDFGVPLVGQSYELKLGHSASPTYPLPTDSGSGLLAGVDLEDKEQMADILGDNSHSVPTQDLDSGHEH